MAQYGTAEYGGFEYGGGDITIPTWRVDDDNLPTVVSETRTWQTLTLTLRVSESTRATILAPLRETAGKLDTVVTADGSYRTLDRAPSGGVVTLTPPSSRSPPRTERDYVVAGYSERPLDEASTAHEVSVEFRAVANREPDGMATDQSRGSDEWAFDFRSAQLTTHRVAAERESGIDTAANMESLTLILTPTQTAILEESATRLGAVSIREVPDGPNSYDDDSSGPTDANSVTVTTPDGTSPIPDGEYVVVDWETISRSDSVYRVSLTLGQP